VDLFAKSYGGTHRDDTSVVQAYAQECYQSVAAYMAKYVGKEAGKGSTDYFPVRWSGVSRPLGSLIKEFTEEVVIDTPSYTEASRKFSAAKEELTDTLGGCHTYPHKVGVGNTHLAYYSHEKDLQECQFQRASVMLNSRRCEMKFLPSMRMVAIAYQLMSSQARVIEDCFPDFLVWQSQLPISLMLILEESLRDAFMVDRSRLSNTELQSIVMEAYPLILVSPIGTPTSLARRNYLSALQKEIKLYEAKESDWQSRKMTLAFQSKIRQGLDRILNECQRSTTPINSDEDERGSTRIESGLVEVESLPTQTLLFK